MRRGEDGVAFPAGAKGAAVVGIGMDQITAHRVHHALRNLGAAGPVEIDRRAAGVPERERGELAADERKVNV